MKAVNLIPGEARRGGADGPSDLAVYGVLGGLALLLVAVTLYVLAGAGIAQKKTDLATAQREAGTAKAQLAALKPYVDFAQAAKSRDTTVRQLAASRFQWSRTMDELAKVVGKNVWLTGLQGTVAPGVAIDGGSGASSDSSFRDAFSGPAVSLTGCAASNQEVVRFVSRLRAMTGVTRVALSDAQKSDTTAGAAGPTGSGGGGSSGCGTDHWPQFNLVVAYADLPVPTPVGSGATPTPSSASTTPGTSGTSSSTGATTTPPVGQ